MFFKERFACLYCLVINVHLCGLLLLLFVLFATTLVEYHEFKTLSTLFLNFFKIIFLKKFNAERGI